MSPLKRFFSFPKIEGRISFTRHNNGRRRLRCKRWTKGFFQTYSAYFPKVLNLFSDFGPDFHVKNCGIFRGLLIAVFCLPSHVYYFALFHYTLCPRRLASTGCITRALLPSCFLLIRPQGGTNKKSKDRKTKKWGYSPPTITLDVFCWTMIWHCHL